MECVAVAGDIRYRAVWLATATIVGLLYFWLVGIGEVGDRFAWDNRLNRYYGLSGGPAVSSGDAVNEYYGLLGRAFAARKLNLPVNPRPELLALPNPWDPRTNRPYRLLDAVLYKGHFYVYHGGVPALLLFTPWYLLTRHDLPENFAAFLVSFGGYLFLAELFLQVVSSLPSRIPLSLFTGCLLALGIGQSVPFLLQRAKVYEVAIGCGYLLVCAGFYFFFRRLTASRNTNLWAGLSGLLFGFAAGCRPHLALAAASVLLYLLFFQTKLARAPRQFIRKDVLAFTIPVLLCGLAIAAYNYARFDNPLEFGLRYQLGDASYQRFKLSVGNILPGLYYLLICPPDVVPEFPFFRLALRPPFDSSRHMLPAQYFLEPVAGVASLCPLALLAVLVLTVKKRWRDPPPAYVLISAMLLFTAACTLFLAATGLSSQRFEVDFLPFLLFVACTATSELLGRLMGWRRIVAAIALVALAVYTLTANLALAVQGPYDQFVQAQPRSYVRLARWFSPIKRFRPLLNPSLRIRAFFEFSEPCPPRREPLVSAGEFGSRYLLSAECASDPQQGSVLPSKIRLVSETSVRDPDARSVELPFPSSGRNLVGLDFNPSRRTMTVTWNGTVVLRHPLRFLVTSPSQIHFGWDPSLGNKNKFDWPIIPWHPQISESTGPE
jgi:hypothetical protein